MRPQILFGLFAPVTRIKGVGPAIAKALARLVHGDEGQMPSVRDLVFHLPTGLIDRRQTFPLKEAPDGVTATFIVKVHTHMPPPRGFRGARKPYKVICGNETGDLTLVFFNAAEDYIKQALPVGAERVVSGRVEHFDYQLQMTHPDVIAPVSQLAQVQTVEPVYPLTAGLTNRKLASIMQTALEGIPELPEWIDAENVKARGWRGWRESLLAAHAPGDAADLEPESPARVRLAYDEILANQLYLALLRKNMQQKAGKVVKGTGSLRGALKEALPFALTAGQVRVQAEIERDMASGHRMVRLLQGDVGSGKTVVALMSMLAAVEEGAQSALMVPTELIAQQHYETITLLTSGLDVEVALLTGSVKGKAREQLLSDIAAGNIDIVIGTHALFQDAVSFKSLALIVIDEQHRFGVNQRMALAAKGDLPHLLHMTATPIPRSLTMTLYGDMDCSLLTEKPGQRAEVVTRVVPSGRYGEVIQGLHRALAKGEKVYWICPLIEDDSMQLSADIAAAESRYIEFRAAFGNVVGLVHGRQSAEDRDAEMQKFSSGVYKVLVATTVVEVGVDVRDATIMVVEQAERFGLAQLHQLRGRVGRGDKPSSCVLLYGERIGEEGIRRLSILRETTDGFKIAEEDLRLRGAGDLLGTRQSGLPKFHFVDLRAHIDLIRHAHQDIASMQDMDSPRAQALMTLLELFGYDYKH